MTNYTVIVNGKSYDVLVEKKKGNTANIINEVPASAPAPMPIIKSVSKAGGGGEDVAAPMPGKIIEIRVRAGDSVKKGQELVIMEAMKMHNPILAASDGMISKLFVKVNESVQTGQPILSIKEYEAR